MIALQDPSVTPSRTLDAQRLTFQADVTSFTGHLAHRQRTFVQICAIFCHDVEIWPMQCDAAIVHLLRMRQIVQRCKLYLLDLDPQMTQRMRPYACIEKLAALDAQVTEVLLTLRLFQPICQGILLERVAVHLRLRALFLPAEGMLDDVLSQLSALLSADRQTTGGRR